MAHIDTIQTVIDCWKKGDLDGVLDQLHDDVVYHYHVGSRPLEGKDWVRRFLEKFGAGQTEIRWFIRHWTQDGDRVMVEGVDDYVDAEGTRIQTPYMGVFEFEDGKIRNWRDYVDLGLVKMIKDGDGLPEWVKSLVAA